MDLTSHKNKHYQALQDATIGFGTYMSTQEYIDNYKKANPSYKKDKEFQAIFWLDNIRFRTCWSGMPSYDLMFDKPPSAASINKIIQEYLGNKD